MSTFTIQRLLPVILVAIVALAVAARVLPAVRESLWLDEVVSARIISRPSPASVVHRVIKGESSPPGWHLMNWFAWRAVGRPRLELLRLLSVVFGAVLTALVFWFARSLGLSLWPSLLAAVVTALGSNVVAHGAELRPYELLTLLALLLVLCLRRAVEQPSTGRLVTLGFVVFVGAYTHYFFLLALATCACWAALRTNGATRARILTAMIGGVLPFLVWLPEFRFQYDHNLYAYNGSFNLRAVAYSSARIIGVVGATSALNRLLRAMFGLVVLWGAYALVRDRRTELAGVMAVAPTVVAALLWRLGPHIFNERNLLITMPFIAIAIGRAVDALPRPVGPLLASAVAVVVVFSLWQWEFSYGRSDYAGIAHTLVRQGWQPGDEIVQFGPAPLGLSQPVGWYLPGHPRLIRVRPALCSETFALSYDAGRGAHWIISHHAPDTPVRLFAAFDHTPRGPKARTPVVVGRLARGASAAGAIAAGAVVLSDTKPAHCSRRRGTGAGRESASSSRRSTRSRR